MSLPSATPCTDLGDAAMRSSMPSASHGRDDDGEGASERPSEHQRVLAVFEHEDDTHATFFQQSEIDGMESCDYSLEDECDKDMHDASISWQLQMMTC